MKDTPIIIHAKTQAAATRYVLGRALESAKKAANLAEKLGTMEAYLDASEAFEILAKMAMAAAERHHEVNRAINAELYPEDN